MRPILLNLCLIALVAGIPRGVRAQVSLTLSGAPNVFVAPTLAMYDAGVNTNATGIGFTVDAVGGPANQDRTTTVSVRATSATLGGGKALSDLQWRRADLGTWNPMTTSDAAIDSRPVRRNINNDAWNNTVFLRMLLNWTTDAPATYSTGLVFTLTVTTP